uniref:Recep_L_domain domain-containing protein n=1 Tax=Steinernema glaseri TaxID=37863 RepID=A0A1I7YZW6_9BILA
MFALRKKFLGKFHVRTKENELGVNLGLFSIIGQYLGLKTTVELEEWGLSQQGLHEGVGELGEVQLTVSKTFSVDLDEDYHGLHSRLHLRIERMGYLEYGSVEGQGREGFFRNSSIVEQESRERKVEWATLNDYGSVRSLTLNIQRCTANACTK